MNEVNLLTVRNAPSTAIEGREAIKIAASIGGKVIEFQEAVMVNGKIDNVFGSLFLEGRAHPVRRLVEEQMGGSEVQAQAIYRIILDQLKDRVGGKVAH